MIKRTVYSFLLLLFTISGLQAQKDLAVVILSDAAEEENHLFETAIKSEIAALLSSQYQLNFTEVYTNGDVAHINETLTSVYSQNRANVLIATGMVSSKILSDQSSFPIPSIASIQLKNNVPSSSLSAAAVSGISNFTYINSPFNIEDGIKVLQKICTCNNLALLTEANLSTIGFEREDFYSEAGVSIEWLSLSADLTRVVAQIPPEVEGVYILSPLARYAPEQIQGFFAQLNERQLPSFTLVDKPLLELGAYAAYAVSDNLGKIPRRIALNVEQIAEGKDPKDFPVNLETFSHQLVVNMKTVNQIGKYPAWTLLDNALLTNINQPRTKRVLSLKSAIAEGIQNNLGYRIEAKQTQISAKEVDLAKSSYLPQIDVETTGSFLDGNTVDNSFGSQGDFNWTAGASFSQLILSEPALANIAIQKLLFESQQQLQNQSELDVIVEVAQRYFSYRQVMSVAELQNDNIKAVNQNLRIATDKQNLGYSGASDVYRWQTELDLAKTELYSTNAQLKSTDYQLNESLNRPIGEVFAIEDSDDIDQLLKAMDQVFNVLVQDQAALQQLSNFMTQEALQNLPEIKQIELAIAAQERILKSNRRAFYLTTVSFGASYNYPVEIVNPGEPPPIPDFAANINPTWNAAFNVSVPIFAGASRKYQAQQTAVGLYQLQDEQKDLSNLLEVQVRANLELVNASYNNIRLTKSAAEAAEKNTAIIQDLYRSGQVDIITLIDAQNSLLGSQINATNAKYQFMIDYFTLQRSVGYYFLLDTEANRIKFVQRFMSFKN